MRGGWALLNDHQVLLGLLPMFLLGVDLHPGTVDVEFVARTKR